jgi:hypothetical protein
MEFYAYLYLREDGTPYYVGKGRGRRAFSAKHRIPIPRERERILIQEFPSEKDAFAAEIFLISYYGRKDLGTGVLRNLSDGGEGSFGLKHTDESREKIRLSHIGKKQSEETRAKMSAARIGMKFTESHKRNIGLSKRGHAMSEKHRRIISETHRGKLLSEEHKKRLGESLKAAWASNNTRTAPNRAFTNIQVEEILKLIKSGLLLTAVAKMFGVSRSCISLIKHGKTYRR